MQDHMKVLLGIYVVVDLFYLFFCIKSIYNAKTYVNDPEPKVKNLALATIAFAMLCSSTLLSQYIGIRTLFKTLYFVNLYGEIAFIMCIQLTLIKSQMLRKVFSVMLFICFIYSLNVIQFGTDSMQNHIFFSMLT